MDYITIIGRKHPGCQVSCTGNPESYEDIIWEGGDPVPTESQLQADGLDLLRDDIWQRIKAERDFRDEITGYQVSGKWFHSDTKSKIQQSALKTAADHGLIPSNLMWKTLDGSFVLMTSALANSIFVESMLMSTRVFAAAEVHRLTMQAMPDPTFYDFSGGWPQTYAEFAAQQSS